MLVPKVTLQGEPRTTRNFVVQGKYIRLRAQVPRVVSRGLERRLRIMKKVDGTPLFKILEVLIPDPKVVVKGKPIVQDIKSSKAVQHVDGKKDPNWEQRKFLK